MPPSILGYWGPVTASIDWCEENYRWSHYIAEWWNTLSSLAIFAAGMYGFSITMLDGLETRFQVSHLVVASIGIGSACFHCTLRHVEQQCDETPMVLSQLNWFHELFADTWESNDVANAVMPVLLATYGVVFAILHNHFRWTTEFQAHFIAWVAVNLSRCVYLSRQKAMEPATFFLKRALVAALLGTACWMVDFHFCSQLQSGPIPNPEGHAWWHIFVAYSIFQCTSFSIYRRYLQLGRPVRIVLKGSWGIWAMVRADDHLTVERKEEVACHQRAAGCGGASYGNAAIDADGETSRVSKVAKPNGSNSQALKRHMPHEQISRF